MAGRARGRRNRHGIDRSILEAGMGGNGVVLEACPAEAGGRQQDVRNVAPVSSQIADGERMIKRLVAQELVLSFVPDTEQRLWQR